jgi:hypothetical protein
VEGHHKEQQPKCNKILKHLNVNQGIDGYNIHQIMVVVANIKDILSSEDEAPPIEATQCR